MKKIKNVQIEKLFLEKEIAGLKIMLSIKLGFLTLIAVMMIFIAHTFMEQVVSGVLVVLYLPLYILFLKLLARKKMVMQIGYFSLLIDFIIFFSLPFIWYQSMNTSVYSMAILLKTKVPIIVISFIVINAFTINPRYPLIATLGGLILQILLITLALTDPRTVYTTQYLEVYTTEAIFTNDFFSNMIEVPGLGALVSVLTLIARNITRKGIETERINLNLERYFSPSIVAEITGGAEDFLKPGGKTKHIAIMFCDLRNFTSFSEQNQPDEVIGFLKEYHQAMVSTIFSCNGTIDKFLGDGIMATFGTPTPSGSDGENALIAAIQMQEELEKLNKKREEAGKEPFKQGIGIHYGPAITGNVGTDEKLEYTVIGDAVNLASRIESKCKELNEPILFSRALKEQLKNSYPFKEYPDISIRGKKQPLTLFGINRQQS